MHPRIPISDNRCHSFNQLMVSNALFRSTKQEYKGLFLDIYLFCCILSTNLGRVTNLYSCFVDLSIAFDTINRPKLWQRLSDMGIRGCMLAALQAYYSDVRECVKTTDGLTDDFPSSCHVRSWTRADCVTSTATPGRPSCS